MVALTDEIRENRSREGTDGKKDIKYSSGAQRGEEKATRKGERRIGEKYQCRPEGQGEVGVEGSPNGWLPSELIPKGRSHAARKR